MYEAQDAPIVSISLRAGGALDIWPDRLVANGRAYPIAELTGASLAVDPLAPAGTRAGPAIALRGRDSGWDTYVPMDPPDAEYALNAIYERRPDLRAASKVGAGSAVATRGGSATAPSHDQAVLAGIAHLSFFFAPFLLPLIIWLASRSSAPYASHQAKQALFFHLGIAVATCFIGIALAAIFFVTLLLGVSSNNAGFAVPGLFAFPIGIILVITLFLISCGYSIYAAVQAFSGRPFAYPLLRRL